MLETRSSMHVGFEAWSLELRGWVFTKVQVQASLRLTVKIALLDLKPEHLRPELWAGPLATEFNASFWMAGFRAGWLWKCVLQKTTELMHSCTSLPNSRMVQPSVVGNQTRGLVCQGNPNAESGMLCSKQ